MLPANVLYYGVDEALPERHELHAGPLSLVYEAGDLRYIRLGDHEILRRVYVAVRDQNWGTTPATLSNVRIETSPDSFRLTYDAEHRQGDIDFAWQGSIDGSADGTIHFSMDGAARSAFRRNRIGFCVLHPIRECAGAPCTVEHADGTIQEGHFPRLIAPHQPFVEMQAITHAVVPGLSAEVRFAGDVFEMEDQRNWTDASYKTYCTPLRLPYPVEIAAGTRVQQSVTLTLRGKAPLAERQDANGPITFSVAEHSGERLPRLGLGFPDHGRPATDQEIERLRALRLAHIRVELDLQHSEYAQRLRQANIEARRLGAVLELAIFLSDAAARELEALARLLAEVEPVVHTLYIFHRAEKSTGAASVHLARDYLGGYDAAMRFGAGTNAYFTELNRGRPPIDAVDVVAYSINPQVHAFDHASLTETLEAQAVTVASARAFCGGVPLAVGPVTLRPRFNPDATAAETGPSLDELPSAVDPRQMSLFGAGWTLGSIKYLAESGVESVTYYETTGWRGVMEAEGGAPQPELFPSLPRAVFPLYHVLADIGEFDSADVLASISSAPLQVDGLALRKAGRTRIMLANLSPDTQSIAVAAVKGEASLRVLDATNAEAAMLTPEIFREDGGDRIFAGDGVLRLLLNPYAIARIDFGDVQG